MGGGVLVVEDDEDIRADLTAILRIKGFAVDEAANGKEALARLHAGERPCVIVLDLMMPVMNGWELRSAMLADAALATIPVVVVSGKGRIPLEEEQTLAPAAMLVKPFELAELLELVRRYCGGPRPAASAGR
ncbi:MAG TPA: response regulator [Polyangia bacterium]|jgi:CheY-like chemotaxis protein|nr:response regulator [Polyangia bacterium]